MPTRRFLNQLDLNVADLEASVEFYAVALDHLGFARAVTDVRAPVGRS